jgi:hypothetical protein
MVTWRYRKHVKNRESSVVNVRQIYLYSQLSPRCRGEKVYLYTFLHTALDRTDYSVSPAPPPPPGRFKLGKITPGTFFIVGKVITLNLVTREWHRMLRVATEHVLRRCGHVCLQSTHVWVAARRPGHSHITHCTLLCPLTSSTEDSSLDSLQEQKIPRQVSRLALGSTHSPIQNVTFMFPQRYSCWNVKQTTHVHLVPRLGMTGVLHVLLHTPSLMPYTKTTLLVADRFISRSSWIISVQWRNPILI